jgi:hypothetical protein
VAIEHHQELWSGSGITVESRRCDYGSDVWTMVHVADRFGVVLPTGGAYRANSGGLTQLVEPGCGAFRRPGDEVSARE